MKTKITKPHSDETPETEYPYLAVPNKYNSSSTHHYIVMMTGPNEGVVVDAHPNAHHSVGTRSESWIEDSFDYFNGTLELSNDN